MEIKAKCFVGVGQEEVYSEYRTWKMSNPNYKILDTSVIFKDYVAEDDEFGEPYDTLYGLAVAYREEE